MAKPNNTNDAPADAIARKDTSTDVPANGPRIPSR